MLPIKGVLYWVKKKKNILVLASSKCCMGYTYTMKLLNVNLKFKSNFVTFILTGSSSYAIICLKKIY